MEQGASNQKPQSDYKKKTSQAQEDSLSGFVFGKVMPQAIPLEEAVLGALMLDSTALEKVSDVLKPETFYTDAHQKIYKAIIELHQKWKPVDLLTVTEQLRKNGDLESAGGGYYLVELSNRVASAANIEYHARIIAQKHTQRGIISVSTGAIREAYEDTTDVFTLQDEIDSKFFALRSFTNGGKISTTKEMGRNVLENLALRQKNKGLVGVPSGIYDMDKKTGGFKKGNLIILAGRPGSGKTGAAVSMALNAAMDFGKPVGVFSLEMSTDELGNRMVAMIADIDLEHINNGELEDWEWQKIGEAVEKLENVPIYVDETPGISVLDLRSKARMMKARYGIELLIVDYLQLMTGGLDKKGNREQEIAHISRSLKELAKELGIPVIALAQLSRAVEIRGGSKRPQLSDLRESGAIENDADMIIFIYRAEYYKIKEDAQGNSLRGVAELIIAKHRSGSLATIITKFTDYCTKFSYLPIKPGESFPTGDYDPNAFTETDNDGVFQASVIGNQAPMNSDDIPF